MATLAIQSVNRPLVSILVVQTTSPIPSTTEDSNITRTAFTDSAPTHQPPRPRLRIAIPDDARNVAGRRSRRPRQQRGGSPPPPPPPHNTPTVRFGTEPQGPSIQRGRRALQRLSPNGSLRPAPGPRRRQRANRAAVAELENVAADTNNATNMNNGANHQGGDDARQATAEFEHAVFNDPYVWSRASYPTNWVEYNDRVQHSEEPWSFGA